MSEEKDQIKEEMANSEETSKDSVEAVDEQITEKTRENLNEMDQLVAELEAEKKELQDKYLRLYSEFENYRRRTAKEAVELRLSASKDLIVDLLPVVDDFERGLEAMQKSDDVKSATEGVALIYHKLKGILEKKGLKPIESKEKEFDIEYHEALTKFPAPSEDMKGKVLDEIEKGYMLHDKVIRHAKVVVAE